MFALLISLIFVLSGIFAMLGLGGALVYNPLMVWFGYDFKSVVAPTGLLLNGLTTLSATWVYYRNRLIDFPVGIPLTAEAVLGAPLGAYYTQFVPTTTLLWIFTVVVVFAAMRMIFISGTADREEVRGTARQRAAIGAAVGLSVGALAGLLGIGGGILFVPLLVFLGYPTKTAAATTALAVVFSSFSGLLGHLAVGHFDVTLMLWASAAVLIGSQIGAQLMTTRMKSRQLKQIFGVVLLLVAVKMVVGLW